jgi:peptidoglycan/xylan/chitin deacetylase (PgdA/CDA1 family)
MCELVMEWFKAFAIKAAYLSGVPRLAANPTDSLTTLLFHRFLLGDVSRSLSRERLKRQCDWLRKRYTPLTLTQAVEALREGQLPQRSLLLTSDDASADLLEVIDILDMFELPIAVFVCVGWSARASQPEDDTLLARTVTALEWYCGPEKRLRLNDSLEINLQRSSRNETIDAILANYDEWRPHLDYVVRVIDANSVKPRGRPCCTWEELAGLQSRGVQMGCHSVSHIKLASASDRRMRFEVYESNRILTTKFGACEAFAYPYGTLDSYNTSTSMLLKEAGFSVAFLTRPDFATSSEDVYHLPRITLPDNPLSFLEFCARVGGGGVAFSRLKRLIA